MIRHENDVTNHRTMWLLVGQGFVGNAYVSAKSENVSADFMLGLAGLLVALSAFVMLYQSYQARGYLQFLGQRAKQGTLQEEYLPLMGWPRDRINGWWRNVWVCRWIRQLRDLLEPWVILPYLFSVLWMSILIHSRGGAAIGVSITLGVTLSAVMFYTSCNVLVWSQGTNGHSTEG